MHGAFRLAGCLLEHCACMCFINKFAISFPLYLIVYRFNYFLEGKTRTKVGEGSLLTWVSPPLHYSNREISLSNKENRNELGQRKALQLI